MSTDTDDGLSPSTTCRLRPFHGIMALRGPRRCLTTDDMDGISRVRYERRDVQIDVVGVDNSWHPILTTLWKPKRVKGTQTQSIITTCAGAQTQSISTVEVATQTDPFDCPVPQPLPSSIPLCELNLLPPPCVMEPPQHGLGVSGVRDPGYTHVSPTPNLNLNPSNPGPASSGSTNPLGPSLPPAPLFCQTRPLSLSELAPPTAVAAGPLSLSEPAPPTASAEPDPRCQTRSLSPFEPAPPTVSAELHHISQPVRPDQSRSPTNGQPAVSGIQACISFERLRCVAPKAVKVHHHVNFLSRCLSLDLLPKSFQVDLQPICYGADEHLRTVWRRVLDRAGLELLDATVNHLSACLDRLTTECRQIGENLLSFLLDDEPSDCSGLVADSLGTLLRACEVEAGSCERRRQRKLQWLGNLRNRNLMEVNAPPESTPPLLDLSSRFFASFPRPSGCSPLNSCLLTSQPTEGDSQQSVVGSDRPSGISQLHSSPIYSLPSSLLGQPPSLDSWRLGPILLTLEPPRLACLLHPLVSELCRARRNHSGSFPYFPPPPPSIPTNSGSSQPARRGCPVFS